jgi:site-specific recombinase XerD
MSSRGTAPLRLAGVPATPHAFRHAKAPILLARGASMPQISELLCHRDTGVNAANLRPYATSHLRETFDKYSATIDEVAEEVTETSSS